MADLARLRAELAEAAASPIEGARRICEVGLAAVPADGAAIAVMADANVRDVVYASDPAAVVLEELQFELGEGPCVTAFDSGRPVLVSDLRAAGARWPMFTAAALERTPARGAFAFPLRSGAIKVGVLDLYRSEPEELSREQLASALLVADAALWSLLDRRARAAGAGSDRARTTPGANSADGAVEGRWPLVLQRDHSAVYQATGMVIAQAGVSAEEALALLRGYAFAHNLSLDEVATDTLARRLRFDHDQEDT